MSTQNLALILQAECLQQYEDTAHINHLSIDSRKVVFGEQTLFFAIVSEQNNGHKYLIELYSKGVRNFVVSERASYSALTNSNIYLVENTVRALQALAAHHRKQFALPCIGITGSNGKTIVKEWLWQVLNPIFNIVRSPKSYNSQVGVPLSVWNIQAQNNLGIFEAGISQLDEMEKLEAVIQPNIGIFTNIGKAHEKNFKSERDKIREKLKLFKNCETVIIPADDEKILSEWLKTGYNAQILGWSFRKKGNLNLRKVSDNILACQWKGENFELTIPFTDEASIENVATCLLCALHLGASSEMLCNAFNKLAPIGMRLEMLEGKHNTLLINDAYSADLSSLAIALDFLDQQNHYPEKTLILSDILEAGLSNTALYTQVAKLCSSKKVTRLIGIGKAISNETAFFPSTSLFFESTEAFLNQLHSIPFNEEGILIKGARVFAFERITKALQKKAHETVLEINLNALSHNLSYFKAHLGKVKIMAMVKAAAYGSGNLEIARLLEYNRVDYLGVAYTNEGVELRNAGISLPIMVMNPDKRNLNLLLKNKLEPEIFNLEMLKAFVQQLTLEKTSEAYPIHLKIDTGMHRLGFVYAELDELISYIKSQASIRVASVLSHFAAADDPQHDAFTKAQLSTFIKACAQLESGLGYAFVKHIANTAGTSRFPEAHLDMVRLGIGLYGVANTAETQQKLLLAASLKTSISQIKEVAAGDSVGYSRNFVAPTTSRIATVAIGYADGLPRKLGNGNFSLLVNGQQAPIVGNVCMDMCMLDVSQINCQEGDEALVFGPEQSISLMADKLETIPYEVLTNISQRVKRVFYQE